VSAAQADEVPDRRAKPAKPARSVDPLLER
jgi:hypothetical protein